MTRTVLASGLVVVGIALLIVTTVLGVFGAVAGLAELWWLFVAAGLAVWIGPRYGHRLPGRSSGGSIDRDAIVASTNWSRENRHQLRMRLGVGLVVAGTVGFVVATVLNLGSLGVVWLLLAVAGGVLVALAWRLSRGIAADHTREVRVQLPDGVALHSFHVGLRRLAEDLGYAIAGDTSPSEGGRPAAYDDDVFLSHGSIHARQRPVAAAIPLLPDDVDDPYLERVVTAIPVGLVGVVVGVSLLLVSPAPMAAEPNRGLYDAVHLIGGLFALAGLGLVVYGYVRRTREWGDIYCVEEGTVYATEANLHGDRGLAGTDGEVPSASGPDAACELVVTLGASCTSLYDEEELLEDLETLAEAVPDIAADCRHERFERSSVDDVAGLAGGRTATSADDD